MSKKANINVMFISVTGKKLDKTHNLALKKVTARTKKHNIKAIYAVAKSVVGHYGDFYKSLIGEYAKKREKLASERQKQLKRVPRLLADANVNRNRLLVMGYDESKTGADFETLSKRAWRAITDSDISINSTTRKKISAQTLEDDTKSVVSGLDPIEDARTPTSRWAVIVLLLVLSLIDMTFLLEAFRALVPPAEAMVLSLGLPLLGGIIALLWGRHTGMSKGKGKWGSFEPWLWMAIGVFMIAVRAMAVFSGLADSSDMDPQETLQILFVGISNAIILLFLYIGFGLAIHHEASEVFNPENFIGYRRRTEAVKLEKSVNVSMGRIADALAAADRVTKAFPELDKAYKAVERSIDQRAEGTVQSAVDIVMKDNPDVLINSSDIKKMTDEIIAEMKGKLNEQT